MKTILNNDNDGSLFLRKQLRQEQKLSHALNLRSSIQAKLQARHSVQTIASFFDTYADVITSQYYLYVIPENDTHFLNKRIYRLDSYKYALFTRQEYQDALRQLGVSKGIVCL